MVGGSSEHLVACFSLQGQLADERFQPGVLPGEARFTLALLMDLKGFGRMSQKLVAPLIVLGLADLMLGAELSDGRAFEAFDDDHRFSFGVPLTAFHG